MVEMLEEGLINLNLVEDDDHGRLHRKKARAKKVGKHFFLPCLENPHSHMFGRTRHFFHHFICCKVRDKWNQLVFVPMPVLNNRDLSSGGKAGKREGFNTFNRFVTFQMMRRYEIDKKC